MRAHVAKGSNTAANSVMAILATAFAFGALGGTAAAAAPVRDNVATQVAGASKTECVEQAAATQCTSSSLTVRASDATTEGCLEIATYAISANEVTGAIVESGCGPVSQGAFTFEAKDLSAAALSPTIITLQAFACDAQGCAPTGGTKTVVVAATFTGIGEVSTFRANSKTTFGGCTMFFVGKGSSREAQARTTIDDRSFDSPGILATSTQKFMVICH